MGALGRGSPAQGAPSQLFGTQRPCHPPVSLKPFPTLTKSNVGAPAAVQRVVVVRWGKAWSSKDEDVQSRTPASPCGWSQTVSFLSATSRCEAERGGLKSRVRLAVSVSVSIARDESPDSPRPMTVLAGRAAQDRRRPPSTARLGAVGSRLDPAGHGEAPPRCAPPALDLARGRRRPSRAESPPIKVLLLMHLLVVVFFPLGSACVVLVPSTSLNRTMRVRASGPLVLVAGVRSLLIGNGSRGRAASRRSTWPTQTCAGSPKRMQQPSAHRTAPR